MVVPQLVLVPLLAYDLRKHRLGYGGGYYDATIRRFRSLGYPTKFAGVGLECLFVKSLPTTLLDEPLDFVITEANVF